MWLKNACGTAVSDPPPRLCHCSAENDPRPNITFSVGVLTTEDQGEGRRTKYTENQMDYNL